MEDTLIKFQGGQCYASSCGSKNPIAALIAQTMLKEANSFSVAQTQDVQAQTVGHAVQSSGVALG